MPRSPGGEDHFRTYGQGFEKWGLHVRRHRHARKVAYTTLGDLFFMMLVTEWCNRALDPEAETDALLDLEDACRGPDGIVVTEIRYLIEASWPDCAHRR